MVTKMVEITCTRNEKKITHGICLHIWCSLKEKVKGG